MNHYSQSKTQMDPKSEEGRAAQNLHRIKKKDNELYRHLIALIKKMAK